MIDLRSDTITKPSTQMLEAIKGASFDDAFFDIDRSTRYLEKHCAKLFGFEEAMFTISGTMSNQLAVKVHTSPGDEVLIDQAYHINYYEAAATCLISNVHLNTVKTQDGIIDLNTIDEVLVNRNKSIYRNRIKLLCLESSINYHSGKIFPFEKLNEVANFAKQQGWQVHLDGARIFNALVEDKVEPAVFSRAVDTMIFSLSKGLGAPFGSILMGSQEFIEKARIYNKWIGGGMHQSGLLAAMGLYAIENNMSRIKEDNNNAKLLASKVKEAKIKGLHIPNGDTNIVMFDLAKLKIPASNLITELSRRGVRLYEWSEYIARAVTNLNVTEQDIRFSAEEIVKTIKEMISIGCCG